VYFSDAQNNPLELMHVMHLSRLLHCAPNVEVLGLFNAGPIYRSCLDRVVNPDGFWRNTDAWSSIPASLPPVPLSALRELEYTGAGPTTLYHFLSFFPSPALRSLDIAIVEFAPSTGLPVYGPVTCYSNVLPPDEPTLRLQNVTLPCLDRLRIEVTSADSLRGSFLRVHTPALETLSLVNIDLKPRQRQEVVHDAPPPAITTTAVQDLPMLPRPDSIFRDPRTPRLVSLSLAGFMLNAEQSVDYLAYAPALHALSLDIVLGANVLLEALARGPPFVCPQLRELELWQCDDLFAGALRDVVELRSRAGVQAGAKGTTPVRTIKPRKSKSAVEAGVSQAGALISMSVARIARVDVTGCNLVSMKEVNELALFGVEASWSPGAPASPMIS
jgi:hypothetical protein